MPQGPLILIVGVCASGKTTLSLGLRELGYNVRSLAQEHSVSGKIWQRYKPDILVMLNCSYETIKSRKLISWGPERYQAQLKLLENAREHATLIIETDQFTPEELIQYVSKLLLDLGIKPRQEVL